MSVGMYALTSRAEALLYLGNVPNAPGLWLYCTASDATAATAKVSSTDLVLTITGGTADGANTLTFDDSDKNTLTELVDAINDLTGWLAGLIYNASAESADLVSTGTLPCLGADNELVLNIGQGYVIDKLIDRATDLIERHCNRKLDTRNYTNEPYRGSGTNRLVLAQYPVTSVASVKIGRKSAFGIKNTTGATSAYIEITPTTIKLTVDGTTQNITIASYATITLLIAAIEAVTGWSCTLTSSAYGAMAATEILPRSGARYCLNQLVDVEIPWDYAYDYYIENETDEFRNAGILFSPTGWKKGEEYFISHTAGFTTIPMALEDSCLTLVKYKFDKIGQTAGLRSESLGDYSYTLADIKNALPEDLLAALDMFKRRVI
jgi:hypothetical protein